MQQTIPIAALFPTDTPSVVVLGVGVVLIALAVLFFALMLLSRRQARRDMREIVLAVEELRSGLSERRVELDSRSPLAVVADSVNRMAQDVGLRLGRAEQAMGRLEAFTESVRDYGVISTDNDWEVKSFSPGAAFLFGWSEDEILGRPASVLFDENSWKDLLPKLARRSLREQGVEMRADLVRRDGSVFKGVAIVRLLMVQRENDSRGYMLVVRDVTPQVRLEHDLRESETRYRSLVEGLAEGVFILRDGKVAYANPAMHGLAGLTDETLVGRGIVDHVATPDVLVVDEVLTRLMGTQGQATVNCTLIDSAREPVAEVRMHATGIEHEGKPAVLVSVFDKTVERRVEIELRRNEARLDAVLEATSDGIVVISDSLHDGGVVRMTNEAFAGLFGLNAIRVLGATENDFAAMLRDAGPGGEAAAAFLASSGMVARLEAVTIEREDGPRMIELKVAPLVGRGGEFLGRVLACRDLTDQKAFERRLEANAEKLRESNAALEKSYGKLNSVNADLEQRARRVEELNGELRALDEMKSNLLGNVSHELQTPLVSIRGYTEMILKERLGPVTEEQRKGLGLALKNIDRLIAMIDNLLAFARMDREAAEIKISTFSLRALIQETLELLRDRATERSLQMSVDLDPTEIPIKGDRDKIYEVFVNLVTNAVKFNRVGGTVVVVARRGKPGYAMVEVRDTGIGIPEDALERVFDRFYQVAAGDRPPERGSGIGLSIVRDVLRLHGCTIRVESTVGKGSTFSFTLPLAEERGGDVTPEGAPEASEPDFASDANPPRFRVIRRE